MGHDMVLRAPVRNDLMSGYFAGAGAIVSFFSMSFFSAFFAFLAFFTFFAFFTSFFSAILGASLSGAAGAAGACAKADVVKRKTKPMTNNAKRFILNYLLKIFDFNIHMCNPRTIMIFIGQSSIKYLISLNNIKYLFLGKCLFHPKIQGRWGISPHPVGIFSSLWRELGK
jgi:hypothetical protein